AQLASPILGQACSVSGTAYCLHLPVYRYHFNRPDCPLVPMGSTSRFLAVVCSAVAAVGYPLGCALTIHSSRRRFAARLNSGVRPLSVLHSKTVLSVVSSAGFRPAPAVASLSIALPASLRWPLHRSLPVSALRSTAGFGWPASPSGSPGPVADTRPQLGLVASPRPSCCSVSAQGLGCRGSGASAGRRRPNKSFKPNPLRYAKHMAGKACHVF